MKHERLTISTKLSHRRALKDISDAPEEKLSSSKDISEHIEYSNKFRIMCVSPKGVYSKDDCGKLKKQRLKSYKTLQAKHISCGE